MILVRDNRFQLMEHRGAMFKMNLVTSKSDSEEVKFNFDLGVDLTAYISIIIVNYNASHYLKQCVDSIFEYSKSAEVIVIDNASSDNSLALLNKSHSNNPKLHVHQSKLNIGFAKACNIGTHQASGQYILYLNPDCVLDKNTLSFLVNCLNSEVDIGMTGALLLNSDGTEQAGGRRAVPTPWRSFVRAFGLFRLGKRYPKLFSDFLLHRDPLPEGPITVEAISGACMMVKREALDDVGLFDEGYFMHCEDLDWCMRFRQNQWKILFVPQAKVVHFKGICSDKRPVFIEWHKHKGMMRFYRSFFKQQYPGILMWIVGVGIWFRFSIIATVKGVQKFVKSSRIRNDKN